MKKWSIVLAAAMALSLACPMGSLADDNPKAQYGTPVIDGKIDAIWNTTDKISVIWAGDETATRYNAADKPLKDSYARVMWDENNLYFLVYAATDKTPSDPADAPSSVVRFMTEQVTLFVSETADDLGRYYDNSGNWQLLVNPYERNSKPSTGALTSNKTNIKTATASCVRNASDYLCEISIPWSEKGNHKAGDWLGFNFGINDDMDENGARDYYVSWANPSYQPPLRRRPPPSRRTFLRRHRSLPMLRTRPSRSPAFPPNPAKAPASRIPPPTAVTHPRISMNRGASARCGLC